MSMRNRELLTQLPQEIINIILSKFPTTKHAIKNTSILSKSWRYMWTTCPKLTFKRHEFPSNESFINFVDKTLKIRDKSPLTTFELYWRTDIVDVSCISTWLHYAMRHGVQEIVLYVHSPVLFELPTSLFRCPTLKLLGIDASSRVEHQLGNVPCFLQLPNSMNLKNLICLDLRHLQCSNELLEKLVSGCTSLQSLKLGKVSENIKISAPNLKTLHLYYTHGSAQISTPKLESLLCNLYAVAEISTEDLKFLVKADVWCSRKVEGNINKLEIFLKHLSNVKVLNLKGGVIESLNKKDLSKQTFPIFYNLKELRIVASLTTENIGVIIMLLERFPSLEKLVLHNMKIAARLESWRDDEAPWKLEDACGFPNLKHITIRLFSGERNELQLMKFFLDEANALQTMDVNLGYNCSTENIRLLVKPIAPSNTTVLIT